MTSGNGSRAAVAFYGDDFTGSTDALLQYHRFGLRAILLLRSPGEEEIAKLAPDYDVIGVAGVSRSLPAEAMEAEIRPVLEAFRAASPQLVQYKICSTADSSPSVGSFGAVLQTGREIFGGMPVPVLAAQPEFGRYTVFGNHFAADGGTVYRLDRQPSMANHPVTPMNEADLRVHIARQTPLPVALMDVINLSLPLDHALRRYRGILASGPAAVLFDALEPSHLRRAAALMFSAAPRRPVFALGSGGLSYGAGEYLTGAAAAGPAPAPAPPAPVPRLLAVSGSCSPQTAGQIRWVLARGWKGVRLDPGSLLDSGSAEAELPGVCRAVLDGLATSPGVVVYTALGPDDPFADEMRRRVTGGSVPGEDVLAAIGSAFGRIVRTALEGTQVRRVVVAGGDTSGRVMRALGAAALEVEAVLGVAAALCRVRSADPLLDTVQVMLKGGQVGDVGLLEAVRQGSLVQVAAPPASPGSMDPGNRPGNAGCPDRE